MTQHRTPEQWKARAIKCATNKKNNPLTINELCQDMGIGTSQFYNLELEKSEDVKNALEENRIRTKREMKTKWKDSDNPTLQVALFKLIGDMDEVHRLNGSKQEIEIKSEKFEQFVNGVVSVIAQNIKDRKQLKAVMHAIESRYNDSGDSQEGDSSIPA